MAVMSARACRWCKAQMEVRPGGAVVCGHCDGACPGPRFCARCKSLFADNPFKS